MLAASRENKKNEIAENPFSGLAERKTKMPDTAVLLKQQMIYLSLPMYFRLHFTRVIGFSCWIRPRPLLRRLYVVHTGGNPAVVGSSAG